MTTPINRAARVGLITDQTGALSFMGIANTNVAKMVISDINARGGLLGRPVELFIEDSATDDDVAEAVATKLMDQADVDVVVGGIYSSTRQAIKRPVVDQAETLYLYPEQYEGNECHPLIFCTGPVPAQQIEPFFPWLMEQTGARKIYLPSADYIWPRLLNESLRAVVAANGRNPIPVIIPCHRVIGADGSLTGFGGGLPIKQKLLALEGALPRRTQSRLF